MSPRHLIRPVAIVLTLGLVLVPSLRLRLRFALGRLLAAALRFRAGELSAPAGTVSLVLAPHQDDETFGCGGLIAIRRRAGLPVHVAFVTDGAASHRDHPTITPAATARLRAVEAHQALHHLGVGTPAIHFLGAPDGELAHLPPAAAAAVVERIAALLDTVRPTEVFLPLHNDGSTEHEAAFRLLRAALASRPICPRLYEFPVWARWNPTLLVGPLLRARRIARCQFRDCAESKQRAIAAYVSQIAPSPPWRDPLLSAGFVRSFDSPEEFFFEF